MAHPADPSSQALRTSMDEAGEAALDFSVGAGVNSASNEHSSPASGQSQSPSVSKSGPSQQHQEQPIHSHDDSTQLPKPSSGRRISRSVVPGLPRAQTFERQLSERRSRLDPVEPTIDERRAVSVDRRIRLFGEHPKAEEMTSHPIAIDGPVASPENNNAPAASSTTSGPVPQADEPQAGGPEPHQPSGQSGGEDQPSAPGHDDVGGTPGQAFYNSGDHEEAVFSDTDSVADSENGFDEFVRRELETTWILNLSMRYKDRSNREKFFVTYRNAGLWRRVTVTLDYRDAPEDSLEMELLCTRLQHEKSAKIYKAIRESLPEIGFFDTVTNLKLGTLEDRLHVHVVEDGNEIIDYPPISQVAHLSCRRIKESSIDFHHHMSGFVYKVSVGGQSLIKKEIPGPDTVDEFLYEINALSSLRDSENVINFYGVVVDENCTCVKGLLISYADGGALVDVIYDNCKVRELGLQWSLKERWARQIVHGLADIHEAGFVQGDFTLSNIVIDEKDDAKIIDINRRGCPVGWEPPEATPLIESHHRISIYIGVKSDLFQLGMVLWALAMDEDEPEREGRPLTFGSASQVPDWYRQITDICLNPDPRRRLQASMLLSLFPSKPLPEQHETDGASSIDLEAVTGAYSVEPQRGRADKTLSYNWWDPVNAYVPAGPPVHPSWHHAPRGRSPPSPMPSHLNGDCLLPSRSRSRHGWATGSDIRPSYSDAGAEEVHGEVTQQPTPGVSEPPTSPLGIRDVGSGGTAEGAITASVEVPSSAPETHAAGYKSSMNASEAIQEVEEGTPAVAGGPGTDASNDEDPACRNVEAPQDDSDRTPTAPATGSYDMPTTNDEIGGPDCALPPGSDVAAHPTQMPEIIVSMDGQDPTLTDDEPQQPPDPADPAVPATRIGEESNIMPRGSEASGGAETEAEKTGMQPSTSWESTLPHPTWSEDNSKQQQQAEGSYDSTSSLMQDATPRASSDDNHHMMGFSESLVGVGSGHLAIDYDLLEKQGIDDEFQVIGRSEVASL